MGRVRTKAVKEASPVIIERYYSGMTLDFQTNEKIAEDVAIIPLKRLRNQIAGFATHLVKRIQRGPVRGISLKLQEEERERHMDFVPGESAIKTDFIEAPPPAGGGFFEPDGRRRKGKATRFPFSGGDQGHIHYVSTIVEQKLKPIKWLRILLEGAVAGATAGVVVETVLYPIDTIKTRLQAARAGGKIVWTGLYSGLAGNLFGVLPASAVFVGVYEPVKHKLLGTVPEHLSAVAHLTAGGVGGAAASLIRVPTEVVKQRMQTLQFTSAPSAVRVILAKEGISGLYAGFGAFLLRDLPFDAIQFCLYEQVRIAYRRTVKRELYDPENAAMGALAGAITGAVTTPLDVIKTRLMVQGSNGHYKGVFDCISKVMAEEGSGALLKGVGPRVMWIGIGGSIFFTALERTKGLLARQSWSKADDFPNVRTA